MLRPCVESQQLDWINRLSHLICDYFLGLYSEKQNWINPLSYLISYCFLDFVQRKAKSKGKLAKDIETSGRKAAQDRALQMRSAGWITSYAPGMRLWAMNRCQQKKVFACCLRWVPEATTASSLGDLLCFLMIQVTGICNLSKNLWQYMQKVHSPF